MSDDRPGLLGRIDRTGLPLLVSRLLLGVVLLSMGTAKTGTLEMALEKLGIRDAALVEALVKKPHRDNDAGLIELSDPVNFLKVIHEYDMVPESQPLALNTLAAVLPWFEAFCGLLLILGVGIRGASLGLLVMLVGFTGLVTWRAIGIQNAENIPFCSVKFDCGCGAGEVYICHKIAENATLCGLALIALVSRKRRLCLLPNLVPGRRGSKPDPQPESS